MQLTDGESVGASSLPSCVHPAPFGSTFGLLGAILATPLAGLVAAIWEEFVVSRRPPVVDVDARVERMLATSRVE